MRSNDNITITLIRHAESKFNEAECDPAYGGFYGAKFHPDLIDPLITDRGVAQTKKAHDKVATKSYDFIFVSPLRRALQTATMVFENNPGKPKFVAVPWLSEYFHSAGDLGSDLETVKETFKHVDFSVLSELENPDFWYLENLADEKWKKSMLQKIEEQGIVDKNKAAVFILSEMKKRRDAPESNSDFTGRIEKAKTFIKNFVAKEGSEKNYALVAHAYFIEEFTATSKSYGRWFDNCEVKEFSIDE